jgi:hypothetical protein
MAGAEIKMIVTRGKRVYTLDKSGEYAFVAESPTNELATWVTWALAEFHKAEIGVEDAETETLLAEVEIKISGSLDDPGWDRISDLISRLGEERPTIPPTPDEAFADIKNRLAGRVIHKGD